MRTWVEEAIGADLKGSLLKVRNSTWRQRLLCFGPRRGSSSAQSRTDVRTRRSLFPKREPILS